MVASGKVGGGPVGWVHSVRPCSCEAVGEVRSEPPLPDPASPSSPLPRPMYTMASRPSPASLRPFPIRPAPWPRSPPSRATTGRITQRNPETTPLDVATYSLCSPD